jgi:hypothetical protein
MSIKGVASRKSLIAFTAFLAISFVGTACSSEATTDTTALGASGTGTYTPVNIGGTSGTTTKTVGTGGIVVSSSGGAKAVVGGTSGKVTDTAGASGTTIATAGAGAGTSGTTVPETAGSGGAAGNITQTAGSGGAAGTGTTRKHEDLGEGDGQDVVTIGDSWMNIITNGGGIEAGLDRVTGKTYRHYAVAGTTVLSEVIPNQYESAKRINKNIKTVIMTGGGNDVIMDMTMAPQCSAGTDACRERLLQVAARLGELWNEMSVDGVRDLVVINYAKGAGSGVGGIDVTAEYKAIVAAIPPPLVFHRIETTDIVNGRLMTDNIHPTAAACTDVAQAVYDHMKEEGMRR